MDTSKPMHPGDAIIIGQFRDFLRRRKMPEYTEKQAEQDIQARGLTAPRVTPERVDAVIRDIVYHRIPGTTVTICALTTINGYVIVGKSAAVNFENYDQRVGENIAFTDARQQIWALEGYLLKERAYVDGEL